MKFLRSVAYALIALCIIGCIVIINYKGKGVDYSGYDSAASISEAVEAFDEEIKEYHFDFPDKTESVLFKKTQTSTVSSVSASTSVSENNTGEISYAEIVRIQEEEKLKEQKTLVSKSNADNGISSNNKSPASTSTSTSTVKEYKYVVNKETGMIHRIGCLSEPTGENAIYYEKLSDAVKAGYKIKCTICSP